MTRLGMAVALLYAATILMALVLSIFALLDGMRVRAKTAGRGPPRPLSATRRANVIANEILAVLGAGTLLLWTGLEPAISGMQALLQWTNSQVLALRAPVLVVVFYALAGVVSWIAELAIKQVQAIAEQFAKNIKHLDRPDQEDDVEDLALLRYRFE